MPVRLTAYQVLLEPSEGLDAERRALADSVHAFNEDEAIPRDALFLPVAWETSVLPRQKLLGEELERIDYMVLLLSDRWPPGGERVLERAVACLRDPRRPLAAIVPFFKRLPQRRRDDPGEGRRRVLELQRRLEAGGALRPETFESLEELRDRFRRHLTRWLIEHERRRRAGGPAAPSERAPARERAAAEAPPPVPEDAEAAPRAEVRVPGFDLEAAEGEAGRRDWQPHPLEDNADALNEYGLFLQREGYAAEAESMHRQALELAREAGPPEAVAVAYGNLAVIHLRRHQPDAAEELFRAALEEARRLDRPKGIAAAFTGLGLVYRARDELDRAEKMFLNALRVEKDLGRPEGMVAAYGHLGLIYDFRGLPDQAEEMRRLARAISEEPEYPRGDLFPGRL